MIVTNLFLSLQGRTLAQRIRALFTNGLPGAWYEPSDFASLFQDSAGTTPVTVVEQPIGLLLDKRLGLVPGTTMFPLLSGWTNSNGGTHSTAGGSLEVTANGTAFAGVNRTITCVVGKTYNIDYVVSINAAANWNAAISGISASETVVGANAVNVVKAIKFTATATTHSFGPYCPSGTSGAVATYSILSVKLLDGNHATQATAAARPVLKDISGCKSAFFDGIDDSLSTTTGGGGTAGFFFCTAIKPTGGAGVNRTLWSDAGTNTGYRVRINAANQLELAAAKTPTYGATLITNGDFTTDTVWAKGAGWTIAAGMATGAASNASITQAATLTVGKQYEITYTVVTPTAGTVQMQLQGGTVVSGTARSTAGTFTEVLTSATGNTTLGFLGAGWSGSIDDVIIREITYYVLATSAATVGVGTTAVITAWDDASNLNVQISNGAIASVARPTVLAGTAGYTMGKDNGAATSFFTGNIYPEVYRNGSGLTATERATVKRYVADKSGVTL